MRQGEQKRCGESQSACKSRLHEGVGRSGPVFWLAWVSAGCRRSLSPPHPLAYLLPQVPDGSLGRGQPCPQGSASDTVGPSCFSFPSHLRVANAKRRCQGEMLSTPRTQTLACPPQGTTGLGGWSRCYHCRLIAALVVAAGSGPSCSSGLGLPAGTRSPGGAASSGRWQQRESRSGHAGRRCAWGVAQEARY